MKRSALSALHQPVWVSIAGSDLEVQLVPSGMPDFTFSKLLGTSTDALNLEVCTKAFVDFKNWTEDDGTTQIENSLDARMELWSFPAIRQNIRNQLESLNVAPFVGQEEGEESAGSDSPATASRS